jgi:hypothetical protein
MSRFYANNSPAEEDLRFQFKKILKVTHLWAYLSGTISIILPAPYYEPGSTIAQRGQANTAILRMDEARKVRTIMKFNPG